MLVGATVVVVVATAVVVVVVVAGWDVVDGGVLSGRVVVTTEPSRGCPAAISVPLSMDALHALPANTTPASAMVSRCARMGFDRNAPEPAWGFINDAERESFAVSAEPAALFDHRARCDVKG